ncbi:MAG: hybrid sensor histidine kinase/response regulator [Burkholderiaceae bacterium]
MLSHEIRNPLGAIRAGVELLRKDHDGPGRQWAGAMIDRQIQNLSRLMDDLMDVSRITRGTVTLSPRPVILQDVLRDAIAAVHGQIEDRRHRLETQLPAQGIRLVADATRLEQVVVNLLANACKYTPAGGLIKLQAGERDDQVIIRVADTGAGIAPAQLQSVFALFTQLDRDQTAASDGLGLGLTLVRELVELHGGQVHASSDGRGRGSEFTVLLPRVAKGAEPVGDEEPDVMSAADPGTANPPSAGAEGEALRILLVDDHEDAVTALAAGLELHGHDVELATTAAAGLDCARRRPPDLVLLDIDLPDMSGIELAGLLQTPAAVARRLRPHGLRSGTRSLRTAAAGFDDHLVKPLTSKFLQSCWSGRHGGAEPRQTPVETAGNRRRHRRASNTPSSTPTRQQCPARPTRAPDSAPPAVHQPKPSRPNRAPGGWIDR